jgi:glutathione synthase/RimK-type ligase-like ATP-grasp enzyme
MASKIITAQRVSATKRIGFLSNQKSRRHLSPQIIELFKILKSRGVEEEIIVPDEEMVNISSISVACDSYLLAPGDELALSFAGILHDKGARILNSFPASSISHDKIRSTFKLQEAGLPVPSSFITGDIRKLPDVEAKERIMIKPHRASYDKRSQVVYTGLGSQFIFPESYFAQEFLESYFESIKAYVIGDEIFSVKRFYQGDGKQAMETNPIRYEPTSEEKRMILTCGRILNLHIYEVDLLETEKGLFITDVTAFPDFSEIPAAIGPLADYVFNHSLGL